MTNPATGPRNRGRTDSRPEQWWQASDGCWYPASLALHPAAKHEPGAQRFRQTAVSGYSPILHLGPRWIAWLAPLPLMCLLVGLMLAVGRGRDRVEVIDNPAPRDAPVPDTGPTPGSAGQPQPQPTRATGPLTGGGQATAPIDTGDSPEATRVSVTTTLSPVGATTSPEATTPWPSASSSSSSSSAPATPHDVDDCKLDGWRHRQDDDGQPFANQGACVRFVQQGG
jgi:hypothetical protein